MTEPRSPRPEPAHRTGAPLGNAGVEFLALAVVLATIGVVVL